MIILFPTCGGLLYLRIFIFFANHCIVLLFNLAIACLTNVPSYLHGEWIDDPIVPDWKLRGSDGFSSILLVMKNYTFTCHGQVTTWYYWWRVNYAVSGCEVVFTPYVLRYQPQDRLRSDTNCSVTVLGYSRNVQRFFRSETVVHRRPYVIAGEGRGIDVQPGDFIALQIELGHGCRSYTQVWLRGKISPNTVFFKRHSPEEHLDVCAIAPFHVLDNAIGFISAYVGKKPLYLFHLGSITITKNVGHIPHEL